MLFVLHSVNVYAIRAVAFMGEAVTLLNVFASVKHNHTVGPSALSVIVVLGDGFLGGRACDLRITPHKHEHPTSGTKASEKK
jgi:hypothetical protein